jgi:hypothetical protein
MKSALNTCFSSPEKPSHRFGKTIPTRLGRQASKEATSKIFGDSQAKNKNAITMDGYGDLTQALGWTKK